MIIKPDAVANPGAMVVHHEGAPVARVAMVGSIGFHMLALDAKLKLMSIRCLRGFIESFDFFIVDNAIELLLFLFGDEFEVINVISALD